MTLGETLIEVWQQTLADGKDEVTLAGERYRVGRTRSKKLRTVDFVYDELEVVGIEQNPETRSRWAGMARKGKRVMQFSSQGRYVGNVVEGRLTRYPAWSDLGLPR